jgi:hypothetical protein
MPQGNKSYYYHCILKHSQWQTNLRFLDWFFHWLKVKFHWFKSGSVTYGFPVFIVQKLQCYLWFPSVYCSKVAVLLMVSLCLLFKSRSVTYGFPVFIVQKSQCYLRFPSVYCSKVAVLLTVSLCLLFKSTVTYRNLTSIFQQKHSHNPSTASSYHQ